MSGPVVKWPGSKHRIAQWVISFIPKHDCYIEPCFGGGAIFFCKKPSNVEIINDMDNAVVNLFRLIRDNPDALAAAIALTPWARAEYDECRANISHGDEVEQARRLLVAMWQGIGTRRAAGTESSVGVNGWRSRNVIFQSPTPTWARLPKRIQAAAARLLNAQIENRPALDIIARHNSPEVLLYLDPPYHFETRERKLYAHEMTDSDHRDLLDGLLGHCGPVLLSGYNCHLYEQMLVGWQRHDLLARAQNNAVRTESIWLNPLCVSRLEKQKFHQQFNFDFAALETSQQ